MDFTRHKRKGRGGRGGKELIVKNINGNGMVAAAKMDLKQIVVPWPSNKFSEVSKHVFG